MTANVVCASVLIPELAILVLRLRVIVSACPGLADKATRKAVCCIV